MKKIEIKSLVLGGFLGAAVVLAAVTAANGRSDWEYKVVCGIANNGQLENRINSSVVDGWKFVNACGPSSDEYGLAVLKRARK